MITISRGDTRWAIAGIASPELFRQLIAELEPELQRNGAKVVAGDGGFSALLVFGGPPVEGLALRLLSHADSAYFLDFDEHAPRTVMLQRKKAGIRESAISQHPADFLESHGVAVPGYSVDAPPQVSVALLEGVTPARCRQAMRRGIAWYAADGLLREHPRGTLLANGSLGALLAARLRCRAYVIDRNLADDWFSCSVFSPGEPLAMFSPDRGEPTVRRLDDILGETSLLGILRALQIPREMLAL